MIIFFYVKILKQNGTAFFVLQNYDTDDVYLKWDNRAYWI